jgi:hypothetical protein
MEAYFRIPNREFRLQLQRPAADARYQWYAAAGTSDETLSSLTPPPPAPISRREMTCAPPT